MLIVGALIYDLLQSRELKTREVRELKAKKLKVDELANFCVQSRLAIQA